jgi:hypothetical protein
MTRTEIARSDAAASEPHHSPRGTLSLAVVTGALFVVAYVTYREYPGLGPGSYPLYGLLVTVGFMAAIGTVTSWFLDADKRKRAALAKESALTGGSGRRAMPRNEFGRPAPDVGTSLGSGLSTSGTGTSALAADDSADPWDEDALPPAPTLGPRPVFTDPVDPEEFERVLEEVAQIRRELADRRSPPASNAEAPTRA